MVERAITGRVNNPGRNRLVLGTEQATGSGNDIDFTNIPSWVKRITVQLVGVSTNGTDALLLQIGDSGGIEETGYVGVGGSLTTAGQSVTSSTAGFFINSAAAANVLQGNLVLTLEEVATNTWTAHGLFAETNSSAIKQTAGRKPLSGTLDRVRLTTTSGTDAFDAGGMNILYE